MFNTVHLRETRTSMGAHGRRKFILPRQRPRFVFFHDGAVTDSFTVVGIHRILDQTIVADTAAGAAHSVPKKHLPLAKGEVNSDVRNTAFPFELYPVYQPVATVYAMRPQTH